MKKLAKFPSKREIKKAAEVLKKGGVVVFPTDTVVGVGCLFDNQKAINRIYQIKKRPKIPMPVLISSLDQLEVVKSRLTPTAEKLIKKYWPGPLTIVLPSNGKTVAVRMPNYKPVLQLIDLVGKPIIGTSANFHGQGAVGSVEDLDEEFKQQVDFVMSGECNLQKESTVVDCTGEKIVVLRQGAVNLNEDDNANVLFIDTANPQKVVVRVKSRGLIKTVVMSNQPGSQVLLPAIIKALKLQKLDFSDLGRIEVNEGPGSFTGLRVGIAVANALSYALKLPVNGKPPGQAEPKYN